MSDDSTPKPDVIGDLADAIHKNDCGCPDWHSDDQEDISYREHAEAVIAAVRAQSPEWQAALIEGRVYEPARATDFGEPIEGPHFRYVIGPRVES
jgi:hypothetical protein